MNPMNRREAIRESLLDEAQGADCLMVKPAGAYLDVLREIRERTELPLGAYQVSGEYAMIKFAAMAGAIDEEKVVLESLGSIKRAGADLIFSYFALDLAEKTFCVNPVTGRYSAALSRLYSTNSPNIQSLTRCRTRLVRLTVILRSPGEFAATTRDRQWSSDRPDRDLRRSPGSCGEASFRNAFWELRDKPDMSRTTKVTDLIVHQRHNRFFLVACRLAIRQRVTLFRNDERHRHLPFQSVFYPHHRNFRHVRVTGDTFFYFSRPQSMTSNINHIIGTAKNKVIPLGVANSPVEGGINLAVKQRPVSLHKTRIVAPNSLNTARRQRPSITSIPFSFMPQGSPVTSLSSWTL